MLGDVREDDIESSGTAPFGTLGNATEHAPERAAEGQGSWSNDTPPWSLAEGCSPGIDAQHPRRPTCSLTTPEKALGQQPRLLRVQEASMCPGHAGRAPCRARGPVTQM